MGTAMLGEVVERIEGVALPEFLRREVFPPLGLTDTSLGVQDSLLGRVSDVNMASSKYDYLDPGLKEWDLNSAYWRRFAAPWGGMFSTVEDTTTLCQMFLAGGRIGDTRIIAPATARAMTTDRTSAMPDLPERVKLRERWGLGWRLISPASVSWMGDMVSPDTYGHIGSTGTMAWMDPRSGLSCILFTNDVVGADALRPRVTNAVMGALMEL
jgi:CubicO group peptidase (beta-lactamase class C family)